MVAEAMEEEGQMVDEEQPDECESEFITEATPQTVVSRRSDTLNEDLEGLSPEKSPPEIGGGPNFYPD